MTEHKDPNLSPKRNMTSRQAIVEVIKGRGLTPREISVEAGLSEKQVYEELDHIRKSAQSKGMELVTVPARCRKCGFIFKKREKTTKPGKCPVCRGQFIESPRFGLFPQK